MSKKKPVKKQLKELKKKPIDPPAKRIQLKSKISIENIFNLKKPIHYSGFALTDNYNVVLFSIDNEFLEKNNLTNAINKFNLNEDDLHIKFNRDETLKPKILPDSYLFFEIGNVKKDIIDWFSIYYPNCVFFPITEWFGKSVNTLIIVLKEDFGKVVGVVKTY